MPKYRKKPVEIEAEKWEGNQGSHIHIVEWSGEHWKWHLDGTMEIPTLEGTMTASPGDWIIKGVKGEFYPCKPDIFDKSYDPVD